MLFPKEMEKLSFLVLSILAFSFKDSLILENKGMEDQHNWHMQEIKMEIWLANNFIEQLSTLFKVDYFAAGFFPTLTRKHG